MNDASDHWMTIAVSSLSAPSRTAAVYGVRSALDMVPVALALAGSGLRPASVAYVGWFGPRGLASIVFALLVVEEHVPGVRPLVSSFSSTFGMVRKTLPGGREGQSRRAPKNPPMTKPQAEFSREE